MNCPKCGGEAKEGDRFCGGCGALLQQPAAAPAGSPAAGGMAPETPVQQTPGGARSPVSAKVIIIAVVALLAIVGGVLAYRATHRPEEASLTLQFGDEKITIGTEDVERAAREAAREGERLADEGERAAERGLGVSGEKPASNRIRGKIVELGWKKYVVKSFDTGKSYVINVGRVTTYNVRRKAAVGDVVTATIKYDGSRIIGTRIDFE